MRSNGARRRSVQVVLAALVIGAATATAPGMAQAAPPQPPGPPPTQEGPWPPSEVLATDPAKVTPPQGVATPSAATCPAAPYGVQESAPGSGKTVALTFDGGPGVSTRAILSILEDDGVAATFFNIGEYLGDRPADVVAEATQGFLLGNHTWSHPHMATLSSAAQADQMDRYNAAQSGLVGFPACFFRPPFGEYDSTTLSLAQARKMAVFNWSVDTLDWQEEGSSSPASIAKIITRAEAGGSQTHPVVLMHNGPVGNPATVAALRSIISFYRNRGYTFVDLAGRQLDRPVVGDWDGNGTTTPGIVRGNTWYLRNSNTPGPPDIVFKYGAPSDRVVVGDWDGNGTTTPGVVRGTTWYLRNSNSSGVGTTVFGYGAPTDRVVTGDWDGNGTTTPGVVRGTTWYLRNSNSSGVGTTVFDYRP